MIFEKMWKNEFGKRLIDIEIENVAMAAARVVELPPRCNKGGKKRWCLENVCKDYLLHRRRGARSRPTFTSL